MKRAGLLGIWMLWAALPCFAQQIMYSNLKGLVEGRGDTVTTLKVEKRSKNQIYLMNEPTIALKPRTIPGCAVI